MGSILHDSSSTVFLEQLHVVQNGFLITKLQVHTAWVPKGEADDMFMKYQEFIGSGLEVFYKNNNHALSGIWVCQNK